MALTLALWFVLRAVDAPGGPLRPHPRPASWCCSLQGVIGYVQYFTDLPEVLVGLHMLGSCLVWIAVLRVFFALRERPALAAAPAPARRAATESIQPDSRRRIRTRSPSPPRPAGRPGAPSRPRPVRRSAGPPPRVQTPSATHSAASRPWPRRTAGRRSHTARAALGRRWRTAACRTAPRPASPPAAAPRPRKRAGRRAASWAARRWYGRSGSSTRSVPSPAVARRKPSERLRIARSAAAPAARSPRRSTAGAAAAPGRGAPVPPGRPASRRAAARRTSRGSGRGLVAERDAQRRRRWRAGRRRTGPRRCWRGTRRPCPRCPRPVRPAAPGGRSRATRPSAAAASSAARGEVAGRARLQQEGADARAAQQQPGGAVGAQLAAAGEIAARARSAAPGRAAAGTSGARRDRSRCRRRWCRPGRRPSRGGGEMGLEGAEAQLAVEYAVAVLIDQRRQLHRPARPGAPGRCGPQVSGEPVASSIAAASSPSGIAGLNARMPHEVSPVGVRRTAPVCGRGPIVPVGGTDSGSAGTVRRLRCCAGRRAGCRPCASTRTDRCAPWPRARRRSPRAG